MAEEERELVTALEGETSAVDRDRDRGKVQSVHVAWGRHASAYDATWGGRCFSLVPITA